MDVIVNKHVTDDLPQKTPVNLNDVYNMDSASIEAFRDSRGYTYLMLAAEANNVDALIEILNHCIDPDADVEGETAASIAMNLRHFDALLTLLKCNAMFPPNFNDDNLPEEIKAFVELTTNLHVQIRNNRNENLKEIFSQNPTIRHFYDLNNNSALKVAIEHKSFFIIETLLDNSIFLAPHEDIEEIRESLNEDERKKLREINENRSLSVLNEPMMTLMSNCKLGPDNEKDLDNLHAIYNAFYCLLQIPSIAILLEVVAASKIFKIVFDFKRDSVTYLDPNSEPYTDGIFYTTKKIYIGAKDLLDPEHQYQVIGTIAHELCHYAMYLVYGNSSKPYKKNSKSAERFEKIAMECKKLRLAENIVNMVYKHYQAESQHAELIVRAPHMIALYNGAPGILQEKKNKFSSLFEYYEKKVLSDMKKALPRIHSQYRSKEDKKISRLKIIILILVACLGLSLVGGALLAYWIYEPNYSWTTMDEQQKMNFMNTDVNYHGVKVKFINLFPENSTVYESLTSDTIRHGLRGRINQISKHVENLYENQIFLVWGNLTDGLKNKLLKSKVNFQGHSVSFCSLLSNECSEFEKIAAVNISPRKSFGDIWLTNIVKNKTEGLNYLTWQNVRDLLQENPINISTTVDQGTKFFVERYFWERGSLKQKDLEKKIDPEKIFGYENVTAEIKEKGLFLLSERAGEGKTTTFKNYWKRLKDDFPSKWIEFVDLKKHGEAFKKFNPSNATIEEIVCFLAKNVFKLPPLEREIFNELFSAGNAIFLWDGVDEVSPVYLKFMLELIGSIKNNTKNAQLISTRPNINRDIREFLKIRVFKMIPLRRDDRIFFFDQFFICEKTNVDNCTLNFNITRHYSHEEKVSYFMQNFNLSDSESNNIILKVDEIEKIIESLNSSKTDQQSFSNPLLFQMIASIIDDGKKVSLKSSLYDIYSNFLKRKFDITNEKGEVVRIDVLNADKNVHSTKMMTHIAYALQNTFEIYFDSIFGNYGYNLTDLDIMKSRFTFTDEEILRYGILSAVSNTSSDFIHRTLAEYLCAEYFIQFMDKFDFTKKNDQLKLFLFNFVFFSDKELVLKNFLLSYAKDNTKVLNNIFKLIHEQQENNLDSLKISNEMKNFLNFMEFSELFNEHYKIKLEKYLALSPYSLGYSGFKELTDKWSILDDLYKDKFKYVFSVRNKDDMTILHETIKINHPSFDFLLKKAGEKFNKEQIFEIFELDHSNYTRNLVIYAARFGSKLHFQTIWNFVTNLLNKNEIIELLKLADDDFYTILQHSGLNEDVETFSVVKLIYNEIFSIGDIQEMILTMNDKNLPFAYDAIVSNDIKSSRAIAFFLENLFETKKTLLQGFLMFRDKDGRTLFQVGEEHANKIKIFEELLKKITNLKDTEKLLRFLRIPIKVARIFNFGRKISNETLVELRQEYWGGNDFEYLIENWDDIEGRLKDDFKFLLLHVNEQNSTLLHELVSIQNGGNYTEAFLHKLAKILRPGEISKLLFCQSNQVSSLTNAVKYLDLENLRKFWSFVDDNLIVSDRKKILSLYDSNHWTPLQYSAIRPEVEIFEFVSNIYDNLFTPQEIREIFLNCSSPSFPFAYDVIKSGTLESNQIVSNYLLNIFKTSSERRKLREFLSSRVPDGHTLFSKLVEDEENPGNVQIIINMIEKTFDSNETILIDDYLKMIQIPTRIETFFKLKSEFDVKKLREKPWNSNDFEYFIKNWNNIKESHGDDFYSLLTSRDNKSRSILYEAAALKEGKFMKNIAINLKALIDQKSIKAMIFEQENYYKRNLLMEAVSKRNVEDLKFLWNYISQFITKRDWKNLLMAEEIYGKSVFHFAVRNKDPKSLQFITQMYEDIIFRQNIRDLVLKVNANWYPYTFEAFTEGSVATCQEMRDYILEIFKLRRSVVKNLFFYLKDGEKVFKDFNVVDLKEKIALFSGLPEIYEP